MELKILGDSYPFPEYLEREEVGTKWCRQPILSPDAGKEIETPIIILRPKRGYEMEEVRYQNGLFTYAIFAENGEVVSAFQLRHDYHQTYIFSRLIPDRLERTVAEFLAKKATFAQLRAAISMP